MRIRSFVIAYALVLAILLFADRRPGSMPQDRYSHVVDLTDATAQHATTESRTHIIAPDTLIPGTWTAGQIPPERLVAPLIVIDLTCPTERSERPVVVIDQTCHPERSGGPAVSNRAPNFAHKDSLPQISLDDIAAWESHHGIIPQGAVVAIRSSSTNDRSKAGLASAPFPISRDATMFLIEARYTIGFAVETPVNLNADRTLARQLALHGSYVVEGAAPFTSLPATGSLVIVAPAKNRKPGEAPVRILAMVR